MSIQQYHDTRVQKQEIRTHEETQKHNIWAEQLDHMNLKQVRQKAKKYVHKHKAQTSIKLLDNQNS